MYIHVYRISGITIIPKFSGLKQKNFILTHVPGVKWNLTDLDKGTCTKCMVLAPTFRLDPHLLCVSLILALTGYPIHVLLMALAEVQEG